MYKFNLYITIFNWVIYFTYFSLSIFLSHALPSRFYNFIEANNDLFDNSQKFLKQSKINFESKNVTAIFIGMSLAMIISFIFIRYEENQLNTFIIIRTGDLLFFLMDILVLLITVIFFCSIEDLLWKIFNLIRLIGTNKYPININIVIIRQGNLRIISKWHIYGLLTIVFFQVPYLVYNIFTFSETGYTLMLLLNISSMLFIAMFSIFLFSIKHIHTQIKNFKQQQIKTWLSQIQDEFSKQEPNYLKISSLEISLSKIEKTPNWPIGFDFQSVLIFIIPVISICISLSQFIFQILNI